MTEKASGKESNFMEFNKEDLVFVTAVTATGAPFLTAGVYPDKERGGYHLQTIIQNEQILPGVDKELLAAFLRKALNVEVDESMISDEFVRENVFLRHPKKIPEGKVIGKFWL